MKNTMTVVAREPSRLAKTAQSANTPSGIAFITQPTMAIMAPDNPSKTRRRSS